MCVHVCMHDVCMRACCMYACMYMRFDCGMGLLPCMCVCIIYIYMYVHTYTCMYIHTRTSMHACMYVCATACTDFWNIVNTDMYVLCMIVCTYECMHTYTHVLGLQMSDRITPIKVNQRPYYSQICNVCMYDCMHVWTYAHLHTCTRLTNERQNHAHQSQPGALLLTNM